MCFDPVTIGATLAKVGTTIGTALGGSAAAGGAAASAGAGGLATAMTLGSGLISTMGMIQNSRAQAKAAEMNARAQQEAARQAIEQGQQEAERQRRAGAAMLGEQRVAMAANGVDVTSAAAIDVLDDTRFLIEEDAFAVRENARRKAQGNAQAAANYRAEASSARSQGIFGAASTLLTTGAKVGKRYAHYAAQVPSYA
jgi:hypothetical protein